MVIDNSNSQETGRQSFDSTEEYLSYLQNTPQTKKGILTYISSSTKSNNEGWSGTCSLNESYGKAINGDPSVMETIRPIDVDLASNSNLKKDIFDVSGDRVDVGRYCGGDPDCMVTTLKKGKPIIKILVNGSACSAIDPEVILERGKAILEIISGLEANGYGTEIVWLCVNTQGVRLEVKLKSAREYFDLAKMSFWLVCPSVFRRLSFAWKERLSERMQDRIGCGYGTPSDLKDSELLEESDCVYFPRIESNDRGQFREQIQSVLVKYAS